MPAERRRLILGLLREQGSVSVNAVEEQFGVSPMTARRDLALLAESGYARRTHGGAVLPELAAHEDSFQSRVEQDVEVKTRLAKAVVTVLKPDETVFGGTDAPHVQLIGIGGSFRKLTRSFVGAETVRTIERFFVDRIVFSVKGIEPKGFLTDPDPLQAEVKRAMIDRARTVLLVAQAQKFDERGLNVIVAAEAVDQAYLANPPKAGVRILEAAGVDVHAV